MRVFLEKDKIFISCRYSEKETVKSIGNYKFLKSRKLWCFPESSLPAIVNNLNIDFDQDVSKRLNEIIAEQEEYKKKVSLSKAIKIKHFPDDELDKSSMFEHQKTAYQLAKLFNAYALFMDTGCGKSRTAVELMKIRKPAMVVAPLSTLESVWQEEIEKWSDLTYINLWKNLKGFNEEADVYLLNYEHYKILVKNTTLKDRIKFLIVDECSRLKSNKSQITKAIIKQRDNVPYRLTLSGLPSPNSLLEYQPQMSFIAPELLGENFYAYRNTFFHATGYGGFLYRLNPGAEEVIMSKIEQQAYRIKKEDALDLPEKTYETRLVEMDKLQREKYEEMKKENIMEFKNNTVLASNELAKICKLREITSGWFYSTEGNPILLSKTKLNVLKEVLEEIGPAQQVIIFVQYHFEISFLMKELGLNATKLYGDMNQKDKNKAIKDFQNGKFQYLIAHPKTAGFGLNLQNASYQIFFSLSYSLEEYSQACDRIYRINQKNKCTYIHLLCKKSIDQVIYKALKKKKNMAESCLAMLRNGNEKNTL